MTGEKAQHHHLKQGPQAKGKFTVCPSEKRKRKKQLGQETNRRAPKKRITGARGQKRDASCKGENPNEAKALDSIKILVKSQPYQRGASEEAEKGKVAKQIDVYL